jgi:hypothetical protein
MYYHCSPGLLALFEAGIAERAVNQPNDVCSRAELATLQGGYASSDENLHCMMYTIMARSTRNSIGETIAHISSRLAELDLESEDSVINSSKKMLWRDFDRLNPR